MTSNPHRPRRLAAALLCGLLALAALPAAAAPPAAAEPALDATSPGGGLASLVAGWLHRLLGAPEEAPPADEGAVHGTRNGPAGPLIDPNGHSPEDPRPRNDGVPHRF